MSDKVFIWMWAVLACSSIIIGVVDLLHGDMKRFSIQVLNLLASLIFVASNYLRLTLK